MSLFRKMLAQLRSFLRVQETVPFSIRGEVDITARDRAGTVFFQEQHKNVILDQGKYKVADILRDTLANKVIGGTVLSLARFAIGDGGAESTSLNTPKPVDKARTGLFREIRRLDITSHSKPDPNVIAFQVEILSDDLSAGDFNPANAGEYVNEAGLVLSVSGVLTDGNPNTGGTTDPAEVVFSHKTHKSIPFTPGQGIVINYAWRIFVVM